MTSVEFQRTLEAERRLGESFKDFAGRWVAVRDHEVIESAETLNGLLARIEPESVEAIQHVAAKPLRFCFL